MYVSTDLYMLSSLVIRAPRFVVLMLEKCIKCLANSNEISE